MTEAITKLKQAKHLFWISAIFFAAIFLALGGTIGYLATSKVLNQNEKKLLGQIKPVRQNNPKFHFTNPLIGYNIPDSNEFSQFTILENKITNYANEQKQAGNATDISVYFRDMDLGRWIGIDENQQYDPASMLKVVIMIAYYKQAEIKPNILNQQLNYTKSLDNSIDQVPFQTPSDLQTGHSYSVEQLIEAMIINSDNGAKNVLLANVDNDALTQAYTDLGIAAPSDNQTYTISAKAYSAFFRILYNATYLDEELSEKALDLLSQTTYKDGLVSGLPEGTRISHKFGEHVISNTSGQITGTELHDCGIIFYPGHPYALCVMTRGENLDSMTNIIQTISKQVYESVNSDYVK